MLTQLRRFVRRHLFTSRSWPKGFHGDNWLMLPLLKSFSCSWIFDHYIKQQDQRPDLLSERKWPSLLKDSCYWQGFSYRHIVPNPLRWCPLSRQMAFGFLPFSESLIASARDSMATVPRTQRLAKEVKCSERSEQLLRTSRLLRVRVNMTGWQITQTLCRLKSLRSEWGYLRLDEA